MLVLSRRVGETLVIGGDVIITIQKIRGERVRVGIQAPDHVRILRDEIRSWVDDPDDRTPPAELPLRSHK